MAKNSTIIIKAGTHLRKINPRNGAMLGWTKFEKDTKAHMIFQFTIASSVLCVGRGEYAGHYFPQGG